MKRQRRNHIAAHKAKVALAALEGDKTLAELSKKFDVHSGRIVQWTNLPGFGQEPDHSPAKAGLGN